jgi:protein tyrosine phosphatase (PTP) superfamily phosphohydrolase (DUF442 family)
MLLSFRVADRPPNESAEGTDGVAAVKDPLGTRFLGLRRPLAGALLLVSLAADLAWGTGGSAAPKGSFADGGVGPVNFAQVAPGIFRSGQPDPQELSTARQHGIKTLLVLRAHLPEAEREAAARLGLAVVHVPMEAKDIPPMDEVDRALDVVLDPSRRPILVHCAHGQERTGVVIAAYRVVSENWTPAAAEKEAQQFHFGFKNLAAFLARYRAHRTTR